VARAATRSSAKRVHRGSRAARATPTASHHDSSAATWELGEQGVDPVAVRRFARAEAGLGIQQLGQHRVPGDAAAVRLVQQLGRPNPGPVPVLLQKVEPGHEVLTAEPGPPHEGLPLRKRLVDQRQPAPGAFGVVHQQPPGQQVEVGVDAGLVAGPGDKGQGGLVGVVGLGEGAEVADDPAPEVVGAVDGRVGGPHQRGRLGLGIAAEAGVMGDGESVCLGAAGQRQGRLSVDERPPGRRHPGGQRLPHQLVAEPEAVGPLFEQAPGQPRFQMVDQLALGHRPGARQEVEVDDRPEQRRRPQRGGHVRPRGLAPPGDDVADRGRELARGRLGQLDQEQRVTTRSGVEVHRPFRPDDRLRRGQIRSVRP